MRSYFTKPGKMTDTNFVSKGKNLQLSRLDRLSKHLGWICFMR